MERQATLKARVAVVRSDNRRGALAQALSLIAEDLRACVKSEVILKPNLVSHRRQFPSTHAEALSATLDAVFHAGASRARIAEGASHATAGFARFGYRAETYGRPVRDFDINRDESEWLPLRLSALDGSPLDARVSRTLAESDCRVSLTLPKTHGASIVSLSLKNMISCLHPDDRVRMHGVPSVRATAGWKGRAREFLKGDSFGVGVYTRAVGRLRNLKSALVRRGQTFGQLSEADLGYLRSVEAMNRNLVALNRVVRPHLSVIDGFVGMHREGPSHGNRLPLGVAIVGTHAVAVDAVASAVMGFAPLGIGYLAYAEAAGLGTADLGEIEILGDPIASVRKPFVPHSLHAVARHWNRVAALRGPHLGLRARQATRSEHSR